MPELPEVETIIRSLSPHILGRSVFGIKIFLPKIIQAERCEASLIGKTLINIFRLGKNIILEFSEGWYARIHLKMTGQLLLNHAGDSIEKHTHVIFFLDGGELELRYRDIRQFGFIQVMTCAEFTAWCESNPIGPDPLDIPFPRFLERLRSKKGKIKTVLLDQKFLGGLGNIYVDETLYRAGIHPESSPALLPCEKIRSLHRKMQSVLRAAIHHKGSSVRDYVEASGEKGHYQNLHRVYGKTGTSCPQCGTRIEKIRVAGRGTYLCPHCQKLR
ncbi:MAG: DNA-formamidopyrimidine glycosylase [bacterium]